MAAERSHRCPFRAAAAASAPCRAPLPRSEGANMEQGWHAAKHRLPRLPALWRLDISRDLVTFPLDFLRCLCCHRIYELALPPVIGSQFETSNREERPRVARAATARTSGFQGGPVVRNICNCKHINT